MLDRYSFILVWLCEDDKYVFSRRPMELISVDEEHVTLQHIRDQDCSMSFPAQSEPLCFVLHLIAFPKGLNWMSQINFQLNEERHTSVRYPFIHVTEVQYGVRQEFCGQRLTIENSPDLNINFFIHEYKGNNGKKMLFLDTPEIVYRKEALENQLLSTIEV